MGRVGRWALKICAESSGEWGRGVTFGPELLVANMRNQMSAVNKTSDPEAECWEEWGGMIKINA